jgi:hypothetical protein
VALDTLLYDVARMMMMLLLYLLLLLLFVLMLMSSTTFLCYIRSLLLGLIQERSSYRSSVAAVVRVAFVAPVAVTTDSHARARNGSIPRDVATDSTSSPKQLQRRLPYWMISSLLLLLLLLLLLRAFTKLSFHHTCLHCNSGQNLDKTLILMAIISMPSRYRSHDHHHWHRQLLQP